MKKKRFHKLSVKLILIFLGLVLLVSILLGREIHSINYNRTVQMYFEHATNCGQLTASLMFSGFYAKDWVENGPDENYESFFSDVCSVMKNYDLYDLYGYTLPRDENGELINSPIIIFDVPEEGEENYELGDHAHATAGFEYVKTVYETGEPISSGIIGKYGGKGVLVTYVPIKVFDYDVPETREVYEEYVYGVIGVELDLNSILSDIDKNSFILIFVFVFVMLIFVVIFIIFMTKSISKPVRLLSDQMNRFVENANKLNFTPITNIRTRDEIEQMAESFNDMAQSIIDYTINLERKTAVHERMKYDLDMAGQIRTYVSTDITYPPFPERSDFDLCASIKNTVYDKCSFCNYFLTDENRLYIIVGEPTGNSLASVIMSMVAATNIQCYAKMGYEPYRIAAQVSTQINGLKGGEEGISVGALIAQIDLRKGIMKYVNAGMPPLLLKKSGECYECESNSSGLKLGEKGSVSFEQKTVYLCQGYTALFVSWGMTELKNRDGVRYGEDRLLSTLNRISGDIFELDGMIRELENSLSSFVGEAEKDLDTALLAFRYFG